MSGGNAQTIGQVREADQADRRKAALHVVCNAKGPDDGRMLLKALGLYAEELSRKNTAAA